MAELCISKYFKGNVQSQRGKKNNKQTNKPGFFLATATILFYRRKTIITKHYGKLRLGKIPKFKYIFIKF